MKRSFIKISLYFLSTVFIMSACLKGDPINTAPGGSVSTIAMAFNPAQLANGGTALLSGMRYFGSGALTYPFGDVADTAIVGVTLQGAAVGRDINVTLTLDGNALHDNYANDSIDYLPFPDSTFTIPSTTGVIKKGTNTAIFKIAFHPNKIFAKKSYMMALTATNDANLPIASNYSHVYLHFIGNAIQGLYTYDYYRYNCQAGKSCSSDSGIKGVTTTFAPISTTAIIVGANYFNSPIYKIWFDWDGNVASNYKVDFYNLDASLTAAGVSVATPPTITAYEATTVVNGHTYTYKPGKTIFVINFIAFNGSAFRNIWDVYVRQ